jgi:hypothetical protein
MRNTVSTAKSAEPPVAPILFLHMPKAAGTSLHRAMIDIYGAERVRYIDGSVASMEAFLAEPAEQRHDIDVLAGHLRYQLRDALRRPCRVLTMLRDPVDRVRSLYRFIRRTPKHRLHERVRSGPLDAFIGDPWIPEADNDAVRRLNDLPEARAPVGQVTDRMLEVAKERLAREDTVFGLVERFDDSRRHFERVLRWPPAARAPANVAPPADADDPFTDDIRDRLAELNRHDLALYEFAADLFERRLESTRAGGTGPERPRSPADHHPSRG